MRRRAPANARARSARGGGPLRAAVSPLLALGLLATAIAPAATARPLGAPAEIVSLRALPPPPQRAGGLLSPGKLNVVFSTGYASFSVELARAAAAGAAPVHVRLTIRRGGGQSALVRTATLRAGESAVSFEHVGKLPLVQPTSLTVAVVGGASSLYSVVFTPLD